MSTTTSPAADPAPRRLATALETSDALDAPVRTLRRAAGQLSRAPRVLAVLRGAPLGHAAHPLMTDAPLGFWMSSTALDVLGSSGTHEAADRLLGLGVLAAVPTAVTGLADWAASDRRVQRVGSVHAALNCAALGLYATSWCVRRRGHRASGVALALVAGGVVAAGGYLGGHMAYVQRAPQG